jgi:predicted DNA-binding transcriptional regulator YafY
MPDNSPMLRQWQVMLTLLERREGMSVQELAAQHAVNEKTIRRDLVLLRQVGFSLDETRADHGRKFWRMSAAKAPPLTLNWEEAISLYLARQFLESPLGGTYFWKAANSAFAKIRAGLGDAELKYIDQMSRALRLTSVGIGRYAGKAPFLDQLTRAIEDRLVTLLTYQSERSTEPVTREIHPYAWIFHRNSPYLVAFATEHGEVRLYKADRIHDVDVSSLQYPRVIDFDLDDYLSGSFGIYRGRNTHNGQPIPIRVRFLPPVVQYVSEKQWHPSQTLTPQRDGSLLAEFRLTATEEIKRWLLSFGANAIVLEPQSLVTEIADELRKILNSYEHPPCTHKHQAAKRQPATHGRPPRRRQPK